MKQCRICLKIKSLENFSNNKQRKDGKETLCKICKGIYDTKHIIKIDKKIKKYRQQYYLDNKSKIKQNRKTYREKNKDLIKSSDKLRYENNKNGRKDRAYCYVFKSRYGISIEEKKELLLKQNNKCLLCSKELILLGKSHLDHDHQTGKIRGVLCYSCNLGLGMFKDDIKILKKAVRYLKNNLILETNN